MINKIDVNKLNFDIIFHNFLKHIKHIKNDTCYYYHFDNILNKKHLNCKS